MKREQSGNEQHPWIGTAPAGHEVAGSRRAFNDGKLWIGQHAADKDILVFDPAESDPLADRLALYSLTQHRFRTFPRSIVEQQIHPVADDISLQRAKHEYADRAAGLRVHEDATAAGKQERLKHLRHGVVDAHRRFLAGIGREYPGVLETAAAGKVKRRSKCQACGTPIDDFAGMVCAACHGVLCSCGACACTPAASSPAGKDQD